MQVRGTIDAVELPSRLRYAAALTQGMLSRVLSRVLRRKRK